MKRIYYDPINSTFTDIGSKSKILKWFVKNSKSIDGAQEILDKLRGDSSSDDYENAAKFMKNHGGEDFTDQYRSGYAGSSSTYDNRRKSDFYEGFVKDYKNESKRDYKNLKRNILIGKLYETLSLGGVGMGLGTSIASMIPINDQKIITKVLKDHPDATEEELVYYLKQYRLRKRSINAIIGLLAGGLIGGGTGYINSAIEGEERKRRFKSNYKAQRNYQER